MISLAVMGILLMSVVGLAQSYIANARLRTTADELRVGLMTARIEAIKRNTVIAFTPSSTGGWSMEDIYNSTPLPQKSITTTPITVTVLDKNGNSISKVSFTGSGRPGSKIPDTSTVINYPLKLSVKPTVANSDITDLEVRLESGGQIKVCNPNGVGVLKC